MTTHGDRGDIVLGWLTKLTVVLGVGGVLVFDGVALAAAHFEAADQAGAAARAAADEYHGSHDVQKAYDAAYAAVAETGDTVGTQDFRVAPDGAVSLSVTRTAHTLVLEKVGPLQHLATTTAAGSGRPPS